MKFLFDFFPILLFFIAFKVYGIFTATAVLMVATLLQVGYFWIKNRHLENIHIITLVLVLTLGSATLFFQDILFIKWKPTAIYWVFALLFLGSQFIGTKTIMQRMLDNKLELPSIAWRRLNMSWAGFFMAMGFINLYVVYNFSTDVWVNFKLFGTLGLTLIFIVIQAIYMGKHMQTKEER
jgi:intracellular septation protein